MEKITLNYSHRFPFYWAEKFLVAFCKTRVFLSGTLVSTLCNDYEWECQQITLQVYFSHNYKIRFLATIEKKKEERVIKEKEKRKTEKRKSY